MIIRAESCEDLFSGFPARSDINLAVQPQNMVRYLVIRVKDVNGLYYL